MTQLYRKKKGAKAKGFQFGEYTRANKGKLSYSKRGKMGKGKKYRKSKRSY